MLIRIIYTLLLFLIAPFFLYGLYKKKPNKPEFGKRWIEHFGFAKKTEGNNRPLWMHTVSVGEVIATIPLIKALKEQNPQQIIVVTTTTSTGAAEVKKLGDLVEHRYMPLDFSFAVKRFIKAINPSALMIMETELWPNTLHTAKSFNIPVTIINARLSERSFLRYQKFQFIFDLLAKNIDKILCQASTHLGEDELILQAHKRLLKTTPEALLIIVPRHPERFLTVTELSKEIGFNTVTRTSKQNVSLTTSVYIADTMGEMLVLVGASDICFMGGSLLGDKVGGHNLLEPAALAKACLTGPSFYNFKLISEQLIKAEACIICSSANEITENLTTLFADKNLQDKMGNAALAVVNNNKGALVKTLSAITLH